MIKAIESKACQIPALTRKMIYLAETTADLKKARDDFRTSFSAKGFTILPDRQLPIRPDDGDFKATVRDLVQQCKLSVHLIGNRYGSVPEGEEKSVPELQCDLAAEQMQNDPSFQRMIWLPPGLTPEQRQQDFIAALRENQPEYPSAELIQCELEDLKTIVDDALIKLFTPAAPPRPKKVPRVYLMFDSSDCEAIQSLDDCLFDRGLEVLRSPFTSAEETRLLQLHQDYLRLCDGILIYYDRASELWLNYKLNDLRKALGYRNGKPLSASTVYITGARTPQKEGFRSHETEVIKHFAPFSQEVLTPFIAKIQRDHGVGQ